MKKFLPAFLAYSLFAAAAIFAAGFFLLPMAPVAAGSEALYKMTNALCLLFDILPSVLFTSFLLACSIEFGKSANKAAGRFSPEIGRVFKQIIIASLAFAFIASIGTLILLPFEKTKKKIMQEIPPLLAEYTNTAKLYRLQKNPDTAKQYIKRALALDPNNQELRELDRKIEAEQKEAEAMQRAERNKSYVETDFNATSKIVQAFDESKMTIAQMLQKSRELFSGKDFFGAHYLSTQAERLCKTDDPRILEARQIARDAWTRLQEAQMEELSAGNIFFRKKMQGYTALVSGDFEEAYYIFHDLSTEDARKARDPDVIRYLKESQDKLLQCNFFIDETYDINRFESANNVMFSVHYADGQSKVIMIRGVTDVEGTGGMIRYLRGLSIYSFDALGRFACSASTPYAKMTARAASGLDEQLRAQLSLAPSIKSVPYIMLRSVSRDSRERKNEPTYDFAKDAQEAGERPNQIYLPIPYQDFSLILLSAAGNGNLNPFSLNRLARKAPDYGYSSEVFSVESLNRIFYPFVLLIVFIFIATIAWNYRLSAGAIFKFKWVFVLPPLNAVFYLVEHLLAYLIKLLNLVFIAMAGTRMALLAGICVYVCLLTLVSVVFLSRKRD